MFSRRDTLVKPVLTYTTDSEDSVPDTVVARVACILGVDMGDAVCYLDRVGSVSAVGQGQGRVHVLDQSLLKL